MSSAKTPFGVPPVERGFRLLQYIAAGNSCSNTSEAAKATGINRTTLLRLLETLQQLDMIESVDGKGFALGTGLIQLASQALNSRDVVGVAQPILKRLASSLGLSAHLGIEHGAEILYLLRETPNLHLVSNVRVGSRLPLHATTIGRIILAHRRKAELTALLQSIDLYAVTDKTPTTRKQLMSQLNADRDHGIAWSEGNFEAAIGSAAMAVFDTSGGAIAAINVTGPVSEFSKAANRRGEIQRELAQAARDISLQLGFIPNDEQTLFETGTHHD